MYVWSSRYFLRSNLCAESRFGAVIRTVTVSCLKEGNIRFFVVSSRFLVWFLLKTHPHKVLASISFADHFTVKVNTNCCSNTVLCLYRSHHHCACGANKALVVYSMVILGIHSILPFLQPIVFISRWHPSIPSFYSSMHTHNMIDEYDTPQNRIVTTSS